MEDVRRGNDSIPAHSTENLASPLIQGESSLSIDEGPACPSPTSSRTDSGELSPRSKPHFRGFEQPSLSHIAILTVLCLITYPVFYILTIVAKDRSLFVVRLIVSAWCSGTGFALGYILLKIGAQHLEATSRFTLDGN